MRKTLIALMFAAALPTVAMAMPQGGPDGDMGHGFGHGHGHGRDAYSQLDLTHEQRTQIRKLVGEERFGDRAILHKYLEKLPAADQKAMKDEIDAKRAKTQADVRAVLNPTQQKQFDEMKAKQEQRRAEWKEFQAWKAQKAQKAQ
jgi:Spy/CpxP family protein refolding chaperone